jgi:hypothetical protein
VLDAELARDMPNPLILRVLEEKGWRQMTQDELIQLQIKHDISEGEVISAEEWLKGARARVMEGKKINLKK